MKNTPIKLVSATLALAAALLILPCCGSSNPEEEGYAAMQAGEYQSALDLLSEALESADSGSAKEHELSVARCQAMAHLDAAASKDAFLGLSENGMALTRKDYENMASELMGITAYDEAAHVIAGGIETFTDSTRLPKYLIKLKKLAASGDAPGLSSTLTGLGYGGD